MPVSQDCFDNETKVFWKPSCPYQCTILLLTRKRTQSYTDIKIYIQESSENILSDSTVLGISNLWMFLYSKNAFLLKFQHCFLYKQCLYSLYNKTHSHGLQSYFYYAALLFSIALTTVWHTGDLLSYVFIFWTVSFDGRNFACLFIVVSSAPRTIPSTWWVLSTCGMNENFQMQWHYSEVYALEDIGTENMKITLPILFSPFSSLSLRQTLGDICLCCFLLLLLIFELFQLFFPEFFRGWCQMG